MLTKKQILLVCLLLTAAAIIAFQQLSQCDFINYDDDVYVTENIHIQDGITAQAIRWAFTTGYAANWHPLTWMSHMLDVQLFDLKPRWHHLTNLLFHIANTLLLFCIFHRMTKAPWKSAFVAALFAIHPLHVESVAWVAERKDVLSTFFWMLTMVSYIHYVEQPRLKNYLAIFIFFALGLMAKPMLVTLPFTLLLLDYWPLQRLEPKKSAQELSTRVNEPLYANKRKGKSSRNHTSGSGPAPDSIRGPVRTLPGMVKEEKPAAHKYQWAVVQPLLLEKIPLLALAALSCIVTYFVQKKGGAVISIEAFPLGARIANGCVSYIIYIGKTIWPSNLAVFYPHPRLQPLWQVLGAVLFLGAVSFAVIRAAKRFPYLAVGWLWFAGTLVPVIGIVQVGSQAMADRYTYIPLIGLFVMAAWGIPDLLKKWQPTRPPRQEVLFASSVLILACFLIVTWIQVGYWRTSIALYDHSLKVTRPSVGILCNRGVAYSKLGDLRQAISDYDRAIELNPKYAEAYNDRGVAYSKIGDHRQAVSDYDKAIEINPKYAGAYDNRGAVYAELGNHRQAISDYDRAIEINPKYAVAYNDRGITYGKLGKYKRAIEDYDRAVEINPKYAAAYLNRAAAYSDLGNQRQAISDYDRGVEIDPGNADAYDSRGEAYAKLGDHWKAISDYDKAIEINPKHAGAYNGRGAAYAKLGNRNQALSDYDRAIEISPEYAAAYYNRGVLYQCLGKYMQAIDNYNRAIEIAPENAEAYIDRGAVYGKLGDYRRAISDFAMAIGINPEHAEAYYNRAVAYAKLGNSTQAVEDLKMAAKFGNEGAKNFLKSQGMNW
ncbi:MAG: tetratricopeptide repeat protein [Syntrophobacteraceae bacterium]|jgi:tetratricopeptide (TPR) repeat protein